MSLVYSGMERKKEFFSHLIETCLQFEEVVNKLEGLQHKKLFFCVTDQIMQSFFIFFGKKTHNELMLHLKEETNRILQ